MIFFLLFLALGVGKFFSLLFSASSRRFRLPSVVGEILAGVLLGNLYLPFAQNSFLQELGDIGIVLLLFSVGLESSPEQLKKVGARAFLVALTGVVSPVFLVYFLYKLNLFDSVSSSQAIFLAATLTATSVGVTARVFESLRLTQTKTAQLVLNAAVLDDVLGLLILAVVSGIFHNQQVQGAQFSDLGILAIAKMAGMVLAKALLFFSLIFVLGKLLFSGRFLRSGALVYFGLTICFFYAWLSAEFGLASIVGAFFAGLLIPDKQDHLRKQMEPIVDFLSPLFFLMIGAQMKLQGLTHAFTSKSLALIVLVFLAAIISKFVCSFVAGKDVDRVAVGLGMAPRGEVGLVFAAMGKNLGIFSEFFFAVIVLIVLMTTILPVIGLDFWLRRKANL